LRRNPKYPRIHRGFPAFFAARIKKKQRTSTRAVLSTATIQLLAGVHHRNLRRELQIDDQIDAPVNHMILLTRLLQ
jgi:hypothetical protein